MTRTSRASAIVGIVEAPAALRVAHVQPLRSDQRQQGIAMGHRIVDLLDEVHARLHAQVHEDALVAEVLGQAVVEAAGVAGGLAAAIADEDLAAAGSGLGHWLWLVFSLCVEAHLVCSWETSPSTRSASIASGLLERAYGPAWAIHRYFSWRSPSQVERYWVQLEWCWKSCCRPSSAGRSAWR